ncbi:MAG: hypothetical protein EOO00_09705 [Chitinophagaceae bacterium]|nr:MAG: hypothetical protein EOO00_09705 [Chitinophagaceae bacterium]
MKLLLLFLVSLSLGTRAQPCSCEQDSFLSELISCTPIVFDNHAQLFWNYSCDSSWLTFEDTAGKRNVIYAMELVEYTGRLGYSYAAELDNGRPVLLKNVTSGEQVAVQGGKLVAEVPDSGAVILNLH